MEVQVNQEFVEADTTIKADPVQLWITPPLDGGYWLMRVPLSEKQAIVCFPKFGTFGIGFQHEEDCNTNLPYTCEAEVIFNHIVHNKGDHRIPDADCLEAIKLLQAAIQEREDVWPDIIG